MLTFWPYVLLIPAFLLGMLLGWYLRQASDRHQRDDDATYRPSENTTKRHDLREAETESILIDERIISINQTISAARQQLEQLDDEHRRLLISLDTRRAEMGETRSKLHSFEKTLESQQNEMLANIDASGEEYEMLERLDNRYTSRIAHMTQKVQLLDRELQDLRESIIVKEDKIENARRLVKERDAELTRLIRQRQRCDTDLERTRQQLSQRNDELRRLLDSQSQDERYEDFRPPKKPSARRRKDVTPPHTPRLGSGKTQSDS